MTSWHDTWLLLCVLVCLCDSCVVVWKGCFDLCRQKSGTWKWSLSFHSCVTTFGIVGRVIVTFECDWTSVVLCTRIAPVGVVACTAFLDGDVGVRCNRNTYDGSRSFDAWVASTVIAEFLGCLPKWIMRLGELIVNLKRLYQCKAHLMEVNRLLCIFHSLSEEGLRHRGRRWRRRLT
jgi:hypothetical protein